MGRMTSLLAVSLAFSVGCGDVEAPEGCHYHGDELHCDEDDHGLATKLVLTFTPTGGGESLVFAWSDPEDDGDPIVDEILLPDASETPDHVSQEYTVTVELWNELEDPVGDVTTEIRDDAEGHQFFFTGSAVRSAATGPNEAAVISQAYDDADEDGLPLGLTNTVSTLGLGSGDLVVTLRHMPMENGEAVKVADLAETVADGGFSAIGGSNDIEVSFPLTVQ